MRLDDAILAMQRGEILRSSFPPVEVVIQNGQLMHGFSGLCSCNRDQCGSRASRHAGFQQPLACQDAPRSSAEATSVAALNATAIATASAISAAATVAIARATAMATVTGKTVTSPAKTH